MKQGMVRLWEAVASAGTYANNLHLAADRYHTNISSLNFYRPNTLPDAQPTVSKYKCCWNVVRIPVIMLAPVAGDRRQRCETRTLIRVNRCD